jgi:hypothetical protein
MRCLHRPDAPLQPIEQGEIIRVAAEERLAQVHVRLDEARQDIVASAIHHPRRTDVAHLAHRRDPAVLHQYVARDDVAGGVHSDDGGVAKK